MTDNTAPTSPEQGQHTTGPAARHAVRSWLGIPYATAERFRSPTLLPFNPDLPYDQLGPAPLQAGDTSWLEADNGFSEECLNLNVWAPKGTRDEPLPVIVYIFGGGFAMGANTQTTSNASGLAATGRAIGVSLNYRLGPLGWLSLSQYGGALKEASNLGLRDIITALGWVKENIARFGGDPENVTVTGHSAGGFASLALLAAPSADGLYHHLAGFSGGASRIIPAWWAEELADKFLQELGIQNNPEQLISMDAALIAEALNKVGPKDLGERNGIDNTTVGVVDDHTQPGSVLIGHPMQVLEAGNRREIDILLSSATNECDWWVLNTPDAFDPGSVSKLVEDFAAANRIPRSRAAQIIDAYNTDGRTPLQVRGALLTDHIYTLPATRAALAHAAAGGNAHLLSIGPVEGAHAVHGTELHGIVGQERPGRSEEQAVRDGLVRDALLALATGNINTLWEPVSARPIAQGIGNMPYDATDRASSVLNVFAGIARP